MWQQRRGTSVTFTPQRLAVSVLSAESGDYATWWSGRVKKTELYGRHQSGRFPICHFFAWWLLNKGIVTKQSGRQSRAAPRCRGLIGEVAGGVAGDVWHGRRCGEKGWVGNNRPAAIRLSEADRKTWRTSRFRSLKENIWFITMKENIWFVNTLGLISFSFSFMT